MQIRLWCKRISWPLLSLWTRLGILGVAQNKFKTHLHFLKRQSDSLGMSSSSSNCNNHFKDWRISGFGKSAILKIEIEIEIWGETSCKWHLIADFQLTLRWQISFNLWGIGRRHMVLGKSEVVIHALKSHANLLKLPVKCHVIGSLVSLYAVNKTNLSLLLCPYLMNMYGCSLRMFSTAAFMRRIAWVWYGDGLTFFGILTTQHLNWDDVLLLKSYSTSYEAGILREPSSMPVNALVIIKSCNVFVSNPWTKRFTLFGSIAEIIACLKGGNKIRVWFGKKWMYCIIRIILLWAYISGVYTAARYLITAEIVLVCRSDGDAGAELFLRSMPSFGNTLLSSGFSGNFSQLVRHPSFSSQLTKDPSFGPAVFQSLMSQKSEDQAMLVHPYLFEITIDILQCCHCTTVVIIRLSAELAIGTDKEIHLDVDMEWFFENKLQYTLVEQSDCVPSLRHRSSLTERHLIYYLVPHKLLPYFSLDQIILFERHSYLLHIGLQKGIAVSTTATMKKVCVPFLKKGT